MTPGRAYPTRRPPMFSSEEWSEMVGLVTLDSTTIGPPPAQPVSSFTREEWKDLVSSRPYWTGRPMILTDEEWDDWKPTPQLKEAVNRKRRRNRLGKWERTLLRAVHRAPLMVNHTSQTDHHPTVSQKTHKATQTDMQSSGTEENSPIVSSNSTTLGLQDVLCDLFDFDIKDFGTSE